MIRRFLPCALYVLPLLALSGCGTFPYGTYSPFPSTVDTADEYLQNGALDNAISFANLHIQQQPGDYRGYALRGLAYLRKNLFDQAIADYSKAIELKPGIWDLYADRGYAYTAAGRGSEGLPDLDKALSLHEDASIRGRRSLVLFFVGRYAEALADSEKALAGLPASVPSYQPRQLLPGDHIWPELARACSLAYLGQYQKSVDAFVQYAPTSGEWVERYEIYITARGLAYKGSSRLEDARKIADRIVELFPRRQAEFGGDKALGLFDLDKRRAASKDAMDAAQKAEGAGDWSGAFLALNKAWGQHPVILPEEWGQDETIRQAFLRVYPKLADKPALPDNAQRYVVQAKTYIKDQSAPGGDGYLKAIESYNNLLAIAPWFPDAYYNAALVRAQLQNYALAIQDMKTYLQLAPDAPDAHAAQNKIYEWETKVK